jgi:hypothetical protein
VKERTRLSRWETVGAWLHIWTPPRDADVPPIPWGKLAAGVVGLLLAGALAYAVFQPRIDESKRAEAERTAKERAAYRARESKRLALEQRLHRGRARPGRPLLESLEASILVDARARFDKKTRRVTCEPYPRGTPEPGKYSCLAVTSDIGTEGTARGELGYPFWAKLDFDSGGYAWCKINPKPGELVASRVIVIVPLAKACNLLD